MKLHEGARRARRGAVLRDGELSCLLSQSHPGATGLNAPDFLLYYGLGIDFLDRCPAAGFAMALLRDPDNPSLATCIGRRTA